MKHNLMRLDDLGERDKYNLERFVHDNQIEGISQSHTKQYMEYPKPFVTAHYDNNDPSMYMQEYNRVEGDIVNVKIPLDRLMRLVMMEDDLRVYELKRNEQERIVQRAKDEVKRANFEEHLRKKHKPLQAVWEKYQFTKQMVSDPNKKGPR